jgi:hypothetical protein
MLTKHTPSTAVVPSEHNGSQPIVYRPILYHPAPYERPRPRIAKGIFVLLVSGVVGLIIFAMGQTVWGAIWRSWIVTAIIVGVLYFVL